MPGGSKVLRRHEIFTRDEEDPGFLQWLESLPNFHGKNS
jgi:hypothetical protein